jgi:hypothetical protein
MPSDGERPTGPGPSGDDRPTGVSRRAYLKLAAASAAAIGSGGAVAPPSAPADGGGTERRREVSSYFTGPGADRPPAATVPAGTRYFATDTGREFVAAADEWRWQAASVPSLSADSVGGVADRVVTTTRGLERAFRDLSTGDTVVVGPGTYRPADWLAIDEDGVRVAGAGPGRTLVKPADGANVGGLHVGRDRRVSDVVVSGVGFDGNEAAMDDEATRCHAFVVDDAERVEIRDCFATRTHPYHRHDAGGSGFTVRRAARDVAVVGNRTDDVGDRGIQVAGRDVLVAGNRLTNGYDRAVSLDVRHPDGRKYYARDVAVVGNLGRDNSDGSVIGASQGTPRRPGAGNYAIVGNVAAGVHRRAVFVGIAEDVRNVAIVGNVGRQAQFREERSGIYVKNGPSNVVIAGNALRDYSLHGIEVESGGANYAVTGNVVRAPRRSGIHLATPGGVVSCNVVDSPGGDGVVVAADDALLSGNAVVDAGGHGVRLDGVANCLLDGTRVSGCGRSAGGADGVHVEASDSVVSSTLVADHRGRFGLAEAPTADGNCYVGARVDAGRAGAIRIEGASSRLVGTAPSVDAHVVRAVEGTATVTFDRPYDRKPRLDVQTDAPVLWEASWRRDGGDFVGVDLSFVGPDGTARRPEARVVVDSAG